MAHAHKGKHGKKGAKRPEEDSDVNAEEIVKAAETAVAARAAVLQAESDAELQAKRDRKAAIRAKGLASLPGARKGGDMMAAASGRIKPSEDDPLYDEALDSGGAAGGMSPSDEQRLARAEAAACRAEELAQFKRRVEDILTEFFVSHDIDDTVASLRALHPPALRPEIAKRILLLSLDRSDTDRELASRLLSACYGEVLTMLHISKGFNMLFELGSDMEKDSPDAIRTLARFLARAVVDEVLPPAFLMDPDVEAAGGPVVEEARSLLSAPHAAARMEHVWGAAAAASVVELKEQVHLAVEELFDTGSVVEFERCVRDLASPSFHHEVVKRAIVVAVGREDRERRLAAEALKHLGPAGVGLISETQGERGIRRVLAQKADLALDTPAAPALVDELVAAATAAGLAAPAADALAGASAAAATAEHSA
ncbi:hypothetical protein FNF31_04393 [Cafeteria roenbergensis]|uniref:MI domain-containing protein n=1 Tax=Cafeteria roenbergensis TaxID=33653 RepID=A0A5A8DNB2_CAFRO|nr:hypothetical protein FNF31_04393 [Cafeteria roenbergensis]KAA0166926.1 hypothetical protein FNF28_02998 [Cafeteria roenbergensis]